ncbi:MAG: hypothetical protein KDA80_13625, partial [Planctomycetaceae bacterium]|nr:hypothetical protein [Planctomycetaceae bacterium]
MSLFFRFSVGLLAFLAFTIWGGQAVFAQELTAKEFPLSTRPVVLLSVAAPSPNTWDSNPGRKLTGYLGNRSCAASSCHGNPSRADLLQSAAHFYQDYDPHGKAGVLLYDDRSAEMMARLGISIPAWKFEACLRCHAPGGLSPNLDLGTAIAEGVGCESCHGSASKWVAPHRSEAWNFPAQWSSSAKNAAGFVETKHLPTRAEMCVACHVGSPGQQVTHDLIAAGHPRLTFEFAAYQSLLPFHWRRSDDSRRLANQNQTRDEVSLEAQSWLIGQLVTARAESRLIRESISCETASFPELSQYDCFACHHDLSHPSARQTHRSSR